MITRLEITGFKSFDDFSIDLAPFVVVAGVNGAGKSNLFDAIQLLSRLADTDIRAAFSGQRGEAYELFTQHADGSFATIMKFAAEMLLDGQVRDRWGSVEAVKYTRLRYELVIERRSDNRGIERLFVTEEKLSAIPRGKDKWYQNYVGMHNHAWHKQVTGGRSPFISTEDKNGVKTVNLHQDNGSRGRPRPIADLESTMLSGVTNTEFPHALAVREEMRNWHFLQLNPIELSKPAPKFTAREVMGPDGSGLAAALFRIKTEDPISIHDIALEMANLIPGVKGLDVKEDEKEKKYIVSIEMEDGRVFSSLVLSEGTLRLLALTTLKYDDKHRGVLCFEEPENGINPMRIRQVVQLLRDLSTDFETDQEARFPARQVLINTHSPVLVGEVCKMKQFDAWGRVLFARLVTRVRQGHKTQHSLITPVIVTPQTSMLWEEDLPESQKRYDQMQLVKYLETASFSETLQQLNEP
ncbi:MAG: AAA family ATPase [Saprospiraceae bacterium]|nr:AAA family ATPase [Saprospiraceae bacterium]